MLKNKGDTGVPNAHVQACCTNSVFFVIYIYIFVFYSTVYNALLYVNAVDLESVISSIYELSFMWKVEIDSTVSLSLCVCITVVELHLV